LLIGAYFNKQIKHRNLVRDKMVSNRFVTVIIGFNAIVGLLFFLSSEGMLLSLVGEKVLDVGLIIGYTNIYPNSMVGPIIPNYPLFLFIITLIVNLYFVYRVNQTKS
jgi:hypothetical protein